MKRFNFPFAYKPKVDLKNTIIYSSLFRQALLSQLQNKYKCVNIDPAFIVDNKQSAISYLNGDRIISFDNKANNSICSFNSTQDNYLMLQSNKFKIENLISFAPFIKRDAKQSNLDSVINWVVDVELSMPVNLNMDFFVTLAKETFYMIVNIINTPELKQIHTVNNKKINANNFIEVEAQKIESSYPTLSLQEAFNHFCYENEFVIIKNNLKKLKSGKSIEPSVPTAQDNNLSCGLYVYDKINNQPFQLISVCKRPDGKTSYRQLNNTNPLEITNELYDENVFGQERPTNISLVINFTNLLFYFLDKVHLSEVVKSVWPDEFIEFTKAEKIEIF